MYEFYQNKLAVPGAWLYEANVMSKPNYNWLCNSGKLSRLREGKGLGNYALIEFETMPERIKVKVVELLGVPPKRTEQQLIMNHYTTDYEAIDFYALHKIDTNRNLPEDKQEEYVKNAQMLNAIDIFLKETKAFRKSRGGSVTPVWSIAATACNEARAITGHTLPKAERRLRDKLQQYKDDGYIALVSKKFLNASAAKVKDTQQEAILRQLLRNHRDFDNEQIATVYNGMASKLGWKNITGATVGNYRIKWNMLTYGGRRGEKAFDNQISMQVKRKAPSSTLLYWTLDGWDAELFYQQTSTDKKGNSSTTYHNRPNIVVVLDPSVKYPIGYAIGNAETTDLIKSALRNAVIHTEELLGKKHKVLQIQSDNYGKKKMRPIYEAITEQYTPAKVGNAKSKVIEPWFNYFNHDYCQFAPNWSGSGVKSEKQPNPEMLNKIKHTFPDFDGVKMQLERMIEIDREKKKAAFLASYEGMNEDAVRLMSEEEYLMLFGETTGFKNRVSHSGIVATIDGVKREYDCFDINFRKFAHLDWTLKFDPLNLQQVLAVNTDENISFMLTEKYLQPMALYDRSEGDAEALQKVRNFNKELKEVYLETQAEDAQLTQNILQLKELDNTLAKLLLTDSTGQHKNVKNQKSIANGQKLIAKQEAKTKKDEEKNFADEQMEYLTQKVDLNKYLIDND